MCQPDAGAVGAAILAGVGAGCWSSVAEGAEAIVHEDTIFEPTRANRGLSDDLFALYRDTYDALDDVSSARNRLRTPVG
jgi:xylulokinase